jgi:hypothetical protein
MGIEILDDRDRWDRFMEESPYGSVFHRWDFLKIVEKHTGSRFLPCSITKGERVIAILPLFTRKIMGVRMVTSPPHGAAIPCLGVVPLASFDGLRQDRKEQYLEIIGTELAGELERLKADYFFMALPMGFQDARIFQWLGFEVTPNYSYVIDLTPPLDQLFEGFKNKRKTAIRKSLKSGYTFHMDHDVGELYHLITGRYDALGQTMGIPGIAYLQDLTRDLPDLLRVCTVREGDRVVASTLVTRYKDVKFWLGLTKAASTTNDFLVWQVIREARAQGFASLEIVGANTRHLSLYKNQFNPALISSFVITRKNWLARAAEAVYRRVRDSP